MASRLHATLPAIRSQLRAQPGATLETVAKPLGLAEDQLGEAVRAALDRAAELAVRSGRWTPAQTRKETHYWSTQSAPRLVAGVSAWFARG